MNSCQNFNKDTTQGNRKRKYVHKHAKMESQRNVAHSKNTS